MTDLVVWRSHPGIKFCRVGNPNGVEDDYELTQGIARSDGFPSDAFFAMDKRHPKRVALPDSVSNNDQLVLVSRKLKEFVESRKPRQVEYLQVAIRDHRGRVASPDYFIVNPLIVVECIDTKRSKLTWNAMEPTLIAGVVDLVLQDDVKIERGVLLFRPKHLENVVMVTADLADAVGAAGFTGTRFVEIADFEGS